MFFESEYRRQAMEKWQSSRAETEREIAEDWAKSQAQANSLLQRLRGRLHSFFSYGRSYNRYE
ncbi:hypothetical protein [Paenibacillus sp.]|uniref:hypothetical protein n=1 Tax=Paenibacillus sp. TaxID=58172 RepID=UPI002D352887|nr:hypothetical protein [Paenibacillus sp.]HZG57629.1 hypothetical protein [Paenibacillus sp.]